MSRPNIDVEIIYSRDQYAWMFGLCIIPISKQMQMYNHILSVSFQARNSGLCLVFIWAWMLGSLIIISAYGRTCWIFWKDVCVLVKLNLLFDRTGLSQLALDPPCPGLLLAPTPRPWTELAAVPGPPRVRILLPVACLTLNLVLTFMCWRSSWSVTIFVWWSSLCWCWRLGNKWWRRKKSDDDWETTGDDSVIADFDVVDCVLGQGM